MGDTDTKVYGNKGFWCVSKSLVILFKDWDLASVFSELVEQRTMSNCNDDWFLAAYDDIKRRTYMSKNLVRSSIAKLIEIGVVELTHRGIPSRRMYRINDKLLNEMLEPINNPPKNSKDQNTKTPDNFTLTGSCTPKNCDQCIKTPDNITLKGSCECIYRQRNASSKEEAKNLNVDNTGNSQENSDKCKNTGSCEPKDLSKTDVNFTLKGSCECIYRQRNASSKEEAKNLNMNDTGNAKQNDTGADIGVSAGLTPRNAPTGRSSLKLRNIAKPVNTAQAPVNIAKPINAFASPNVELIFNHWINKPLLPKHNTDKNSKTFIASCKAIKKALKHHSAKDIMAAIDRYYDLLTKNEFFPTLQWDKLAMYEFFAFGDRTQARYDSSFLTWANGMTSWFDECVKDWDQVIAKFGNPKFEIDKYPEVTAALKKAYQEKLMNIVKEYRYEIKDSDEKYFVRAAKYVVLFHQIYRHKMIWSELNGEFKDVVKFAHNLIDARYFDAQNNIHLVEPSWFASDKALPKLLDYMLFHNKIKLEYIEKMKSEISKPLTIEMVNKANEEEKYRLELMGKARLRKIQDSKKAEEQVCHEDVDIDDPYYNG